MLVLVHVLEILPAGRRRLATVFRDHEHEHEHGGRGGLYNTQVRDNLNSRRFLPSLAVLLFAAGCASAPGRVSTISGEEFQRLSLELSEPPGYFDTDNLISNETSYQHVVPRLLEIDARDAAYLGVGPDQNFTYIAALRPRLALIIDIRRDNLLQHLFFKQLFEMAETPAQFLGLLLGKPPPESFDPSRYEEEFPRLLAEWSAAPGDLAAFEGRFEEIWSGLRSSFPRLVEPSDHSTVYGMARSFFEEGLELRFRSHGRPPRAIYPTLGRLLLETDLDGRRHNYLSSRQLYDAVRAMQLDNRIIPVVGDLGGEKTLRAIADYLRRQNCPVAAFYTSNVEFYLFSDGTFGRYASNVGRFPLLPGAVIVRSYFNYWREPHPESAPGYPMASLVQSMRDFVEMAASATDYQELVGASVVGR